MPAGWVHPAGDTPRANDRVLLLHGKSMPRSGHHLLVDLLARYHGPAFGYCARYTTGPWCCSALPCARPEYPTRGNRMHLQKSHDFAFDDPQDGLPGFFIVQHRSFVPRLLSNYDHWLSERPAGTTDDHARFARFAFAEARYHVRFWERWLARPREQTHVVRYEDLAMDPRGTLGRLLVTVDPGTDLDPGRLEEAIAIMDRPSPSSLQRSGTFVGRDITAHPHYDPAMLRELEDQVFDACPGMEGAQARVMRPG